VIDGGRGATVAVLAVTYVGPPGPDLSARRVLSGLGAAVLLLAGALVVQSRMNRLDGDQDPFEGVDLAVPEWDSISLDDDDDDGPQRGRRRNREDRLSTTS
jgi:hypothetical protein